MEIGNYMHKYLEHYVSKEHSFHDDSKNFTIAKKLAQTVIDNFIDHLDEVWVQKFQYCIKTYMLEP